MSEIDIKETFKEELKHIYNFCKYYCRKITVNDKIKENCAQIFCPFHKYKFGKTEEEK